MKRIAAIALTALATTGCLGSSAGSGTGLSSDRQAQRWSKTVLTVTYNAQACPPGAGCTGTMKSQGNSKFVRVVRYLRCDPAGGDYGQPTAACRALADIETKQHRQQSASGPVEVCRCVMSTLAPKAVGYYQGKRRTIRLDGCSLCNLKGIRADLAVLLPGAEG